MNHNVGRYLRTRGQIQQIVDFIRSNRFKESAGFIALIGLAWLDERLGISALILGKHSLLPEFRVSTLEMLLVASVLGVPIGVGTAIYLSEYGTVWLSRSISFLVDLMAESEDLGFDSLWTGEHVLARWGGTSPAFDCFTVGSALAAAVPRVGIGFIVLNSTFRNPVLTAKAAATANCARITLGIA